MHHLLLSLIFVVPCLAAADDDKKASDEERRNNRAAEAHRTLFESTDRGRESAHFTEAVMRDLPATAPGTDVPRQGFIDRILFRQMAERGIPHAGLASDTEYIRRVYLDAIGLPPEPDAVRAFVAWMTRSQETWTGTRLTGGRIGLDGVLRFAHPPSPKPTTAIPPALSNVRLSIPRSLLIFPNVP